MAPGSGSADPDERLAAYRSAESLADLVAVTGADSEHEAYFAAKREWETLRERELPAADPAGGDALPGDRVVVDGRAFHVHGVTHAGTAAEGDYLREHVSRLRDAGAAVYCEQGIRSMYFDAFDGVCAMDDYRWAMDRCRALDGDSRVAGSEFDALAEDLDSLAGALQDAAFSLIDAGGEYYGEQFRAALGDVASAFLTSHEDLATGDDFESFALSRRAARNPSVLPVLQRYYATAFLPQPVEREWLRRHDRELEVLTHARNERMADYAVYHAGDAPAVHLVVGAAHQPGVAYYLRAHDAGRRSLDGFEPFG